MKRAGNLSEAILDRDNFRLAYSKVIAGKRNQDDSRRFADRLEDNIVRLVRQAADGSFPVGRFHQFVIHDPKRRVITAPCFEERVLHHAIMNVCDPVFDRWLIHDTYACRVGRGREAAVLRAAHFARSKPFYLKLDVRKYFDSICHPHLLGGLEGLFKDSWLLELFCRILAGYRGDIGRGLPIGSLTSQHFANFYLGKFDRYVKESLRVKAYVRYMDDMVIWADSRRQLRLIRDGCQQYLSRELSLELKPAVLNRTSHGMDFLGCRLYDTHTLLNRRSRVRFRRAFVQLERDYLDGRIGELELQQRATSMFAFTRAAGVTSWRFRRRVLERSVVSGRMARTG
jgi:RNA-directed DNA polymerase